MSRVFPTFLVLIATSLILSAPLLAQNRANVWYFSSNAGLDFNQTPVAPLLDIPRSVSEGSATICDPVTGQLLFYVDGDAIFNANLDVMENGDLLTLWRNNRSLQQGCVIVPMPDNPDLYYVIIPDCADVVDVRDPGGNGNWTTYAIVDMSANGGLGTVTEKQISFPPTSAEHISAVQHCNGRDFWVVTREYKREKTENGIGVHLISPKGIEPFKRRFEGLNTVQEARGIMKFSHDGQWLISMSFITDRGRWPGVFVELYQFDNRTGEISNGINLLEELGATGTEFSPDNSKLYLNMREDETSRAALYQFDMTAGNMQQIKNSRVRIGDASVTASGMGQLQLAPDGRIIMAGTVTGLSSVGFIENPNESAVNLRVVYPGDPEAIQIEGEINGETVTRPTSFCLPNFVSSFLGEANINPANCPLPQRSQFSVSNNNFCPGECVNFTDESLGAESYLWTFEGGNPSTSTEASPQNICFDQPGTYTVRQCVANQNGEVFSEMTITVRDDCTDPVARFNVDQATICAGECVNITNTSLNSTDYEWSFVGAGNITASNDENPPNICYDTPGTYTIELRASNENGGNVATQMIQVNDCPNVIADFTTERTQICAGECITFTNNSQAADSYEWSFPGGTAADSTLRDPGEVCFNEPGTVTVTLTASNANGSSNDELVLTVLDGNAITVSLPADLSVGSGQTIDIPLTVSVSQTGTFQIPSLTILVTADSRLLEFLSAEAADVFVSDVNGSIAVASLRFDNLQLQNGENQIALLRANTLHGFPALETDLALSLADLNAEACIAVQFSDGLYSQTAECSDAEIELTSTAFGIVKVAPNPSSEEIFVEIQSGIVGTHTLEVVSVWGETLERESWEHRPSAGKIYAFDAHFTVDNLPAGVYFLRLRTAGGIQTERFVIGK